CIISLALQSWKMLMSTNRFLIFLDGYGIFMGPTIAIMIVNYRVMCRGILRIMDTYSSKPGMTYMYFHGFNVNACFTYICGMMLPFVGFMGTFGVSVPANTTKIDGIGWYVSTVTTGVVYLVMCRIFPL
ncbi:hypothetical protein WOLCODRAFT_30990, partial [Wolfiporia cocos MD-104 SS10]